MRGRSADEDALLRAVWDAPHDDAPRLVYADWLDEHGDSDRAAFIRVQCELARTDWADERFLKLQQEEARLVKGNRAKWTKRLPPLAWTFERGFPISGTLGLRLKQLDGLRLDEWEVCPVLDLGFQGLTGLDQVADWPGLARVGTLRLEGHRVSGVSLAKFLASPHLANLTGLELSVKEIGLAGLRAIVESPVWPRLTRLVYGHTMLSRDPGLTGEPLELLAAARPVPPLAELILKDASLRADDMKVLAAAPLLAGVCELHLSMSEIGSNGVIALAQSPNLGAVRWLDLSFVGFLSARAVKALAHASALARLCHLHLGIVSTPNSAVELLNSPQMAHLRGLHLIYSRRGKISAGLAQKIRRRFGEKSLTQAVI